MDPLAEEFPNYCGYVYTMNNPIRYTDPTGMVPEDWIFHFWNGNFMGVTDTGKGSAIRFNIDGIERSLNPRSVSNSKYFAAASKYIVSQVNPKLNVSYKIVDEKRRTGGYHVHNTKNVTITDRSFETNNFYDVKSVAIHENDHYEQEPVKRYRDHAITYKNEAKSDNFKNTSDKHKYRNARGFAQRVINAFAGGEYGGNTEAFYNDIKDYNSTNPLYQLTPDLRGTPSIKVGNSKENIYPNLRMKYEE